MFLRNRVRRILHQRKDEPRAIECPHCRTVLELSAPAPAVVCVACGGRIDLSTTRFEADPLAALASTAGKTPAAGAKPANPRRGRVGLESDS